MSEKTEDIYRHKNRIDLQALLAALTKLDTVPGITQAITNPLSPLCQKLMKLLMDNAELEAAEICFAIIEYQQEIIAEAEQHEKAIRAKLEARELSEAKKHALEMQAMSADKTTASQALSPAELQERCTDFNALIEALRQNLKTVNSTLRNLSESVDESNRKWTEAEPEKAKAAVDYLIAVKGPTLQVEMQTNEQTEIVSINLERKREQLEQALIIPPPAKLLAMNSMLQENMTKEPEKTIVYFDLLRDIRILGALSTD